MGEGVDEALQTAECRRQTHEALRRLLVELDEEPVWERSVADGLDRE